MDFLFYSLYSILFYTDVMEIVLGNHILEDKFFTNNKKMQFFIIDQRKPNTSKKDKSSKRILQKFSNKIILSLNVENLDTQQNIVE